ncbi:MAG: TIGR03936 family radical SAM-associated protein [Synergistaceae bacterium]|jgi:radical SAM-linked protein|nr:TIGR03936 family radical SAM-associated protein [Synergistaceae bacterium]
MSRIRIHFSKKGYACFVSHIDLPMLFGRAARRAGLHPEFTQGFSPHPKLALGPPLPVGVIALREPADFWFSEWNDDLLERWKRSLPAGIDIVGANEAEGPSLNKLCTAAEYSIKSICDASLREIVDVLRPLLGSRNALYDIEERGEELSISSGDLERCGVSLMVKELVSSGVIPGWRGLRISRSAVGGWSEAEHRVIPLMEGFEHGQER